MFVTLVALPCTDLHCVILYLMNLTIIDFLPTFGYVYYIMMGR